MNFRQQEQGRGSVVQSGSEPHWVFATHTASPGGGDLALARYLAQSRHMNVSLVSLEDGDIWQSVRSAGVEVRTLEKSSGTFAMLLRLRAELRSFQRAIYVANSMRMALLMALVLPMRARLVYWVRDGLTESSVSRYGLLLTRLFTLRRVDFCIANSRWTQETIWAVRPSMKTAIATSPGGISEPVSSPKVVDSGDIRLIYLGRIARWKGVHIAIEAVQHLNRASDRKFVLDIAGSPLFGEEKYNGLVREMAAEDERINFLGHVTDVPELLKNYVGMVHCSITPEPFGQVIVQGMAAGLVVFAAAEGGPAEIIDDGSDGILVEPGNADKLAEAIADRFSDPARVFAVREQALQTSHAYTDAVAVKRLDELLSQIQKSLASISN